MSLEDIHERLIGYLKTRRVIEWKRIAGDPKQVALAMIEVGEAKIVRVDGNDYLAYRWPNRLVQFLTMGWKS